MADNAPTTQADAWNTAFTTYTQLNQSLVQAPPKERDRIEREIVALQDELMDLPAPDLAAVIEKLNILWEIKLDQPGQAADERHQILDDLQAIQLACNTTA